jgi:hypothetical protein
VLSSFTTKNNVKKDIEILMSAKIVSNEKSVNLLFFTDGSYSIQNIENGEEISSKALKLSELDLQSLEKLISKAKPLVLRNMYTCKDRTVNKTNATLYYFGESKKTIIVNNDCFSNKKLNNIKVFIEKILKENA